MNSTVKTLRLLGTLGAIMVANDPLLAQEKAKSPADGYDIHIVAPHRHEDGSVHGPYHHYCKAIKPEVMQCLIFTSTDPNAELVEIEYFIDKKLVRSNVTLEQWNKYYHDHTAEIATGNVQVLDLPRQKAKEIAAAAAKTDGIIFHLWPQGAKVPNGDVTFPTAISHKRMEKLEIPR
ncbi:DUF1264 domain-containing protein [Rhodoferax sp.]|uniref:DUF1264 domain-containing protein n=1 Tax=Rhodoferax sp. TaxID=50421 RepID=UPI0026071DE5|nr:DUF1264 domain-containing protein [Rhodoferax sp.]